MTVYKVGYNPTSKTATVQLEGDTTPEGSTNIGTFTHPDGTYPDSTVIFHAVRDLLYKRKPDGSEGFWPDNITDMAGIVIAEDLIIEATNLTLAPATASIVAGATQQLTATVTPASASGTTTYASSTTGVATVSATGLVTGVAAGTATITATRGTKTATSTITVTAP